MKATIFATLGRLLLLSILLMRLMAALRRPLLYQIYDERAKSKINAQYEPKKRTEIMDCQDTYLKMLSRMAAYFFGYEL